VIVVDTHALFWWLANDPSLSASARQAIDQASGQGQALVSAITCREIAQQAQRGRIRLTMGVDDWFGLLERLPGWRVVPMDRTIALESVYLPGEFHRDPADRIIVATARKHAASVVTKDEQIRAYPHVKTIW
jgi:PIN domain nuclease of toxin-antitoxin system